MFKKMMLTGLMAATMLGSIAPAYAQRGDDDGNRRWSQREGARQGGDNAQRWEQRRAERPQPQTQPQAQPQWRGNDARPNPRGQDMVTRWNRSEQRFETTTRAEDRARNDGRRNWQGDRRDDNRWRDNDRRDGNWRDGRNDNRWNNNQRWDNDRRTWNDGRRFDDRTRWSGQRRWDSGWRNDRRYDWSSYRSRYGDRYRLGRYYAPRGWNYGYSRFSIGIVLNSLLYSNSYWINDPYYYRLPPAYGSLRWIRYYDDALLVDIRDGYVVDVIYDFFW